MGDRPDDMPRMPSVSQPLDEWVEARFVAALQRHMFWCQEHGVGLRLGKMADDLSAVKSEARSMKSRLAGFVAGAAISGAVIGYVAQRLMAHVFGVQ